LRRITKHSKTKKYRLRGGDTQAPLPEPVYAEPPTIIQGNPATIQADIAAQNARQNQANKTLTGGSKKKGLNQRGGEATVCSGTASNGADGYGYVSPNNCLLVPSVNNAAAQSLAINSMHSMYTGNTNSAGDDQIGVLPK